MVQLVKYTCKRSFEFTPDFHFEDFMATGLTKLFKHVRPSFINPFIIYFLMFELWYNS